MTTKPNPLAVMERDAIQAVQYRVMIGENVMGHATSSDDARAAVAELVEAARSALDTLEKIDDDHGLILATNEARYLRAALARFGETP